MELLIINGANVNAKGKRGGAPLHTAAVGGRKEIAERLIVAGANVNAQNSYCYTPLDYAIKASHFETTAILRKHGGKTGEELKTEGK